MNDNQIWRCQLCGHEHEVNKEMLKQYTDKAACPLYVDYKKSCAALKEREELKK